MRAATCSKTANPIRMRDFARVAFCDDKIFARHRSPGHIGGARAPPAIDAMTIDQTKRPTLQHVSCPAANASTSQLHKIHLTHFNHESTSVRKALGAAGRMNMNSCSPPQADWDVLATSFRCELVWLLPCSQIYVITIYGFSNA